MSSSRSAAIGSVSRNSRIAIHSLLPRIAAAFFRSPSLVALNAGSPSDDPPSSRPASLDRRELFRASGITSQESAVSVAAAGASPPTAPGPAARVAFKPESKPPTNSSRVGSPFVPSVEDEPPPAPSCLFPVAWTCTSSAHRLHAALKSRGSSAGIGAMDPEAVTPHTRKSAIAAAAFCASLTVLHPPSPGASSSALLHVTVPNAAARAAAPPPTRLVPPDRSTTTVYAIPEATAPAALAPEASHRSYLGAIHPSRRHSICNSDLGWTVSTTGPPGAPFTPFAPLPLSFFFPVGFLPGAAIAVGGKRGDSVSSNTSPSSPPPSPRSAAVVSSSPNRSRPKPSSSEESSELESGFAV